MAEEDQNTQGQTPELTDEQRRQMETQWVNNSLQKANSYLASKGIMPQGVRQQDSRILPPLVSIWRIKGKENNVISDYWVIAGDVPTDHVPVKVAMHARDALRHFYLTWQVQAENIARGPGRGDPMQMNFAKLLVNRSEGLFNLYQDDRLWGEKSA
ncbi:DUF4826 family protein [Gallaecimonas mangrovi]|uniref:DUF4826 family protein n=1 Tax=Gallaecimonas mangrovi TaxID=2291597 RepID=UPI000E202D0C|nr:DUF4826 family protein [Gallaecimonas mangrovi]